MINSFSKFCARRYVRSLAPVLFILLVAAANNLAQNAIGKVVEITGTGILKDTDGRESQLNRRNFVVYLKPGQSLKANGQGKIQIKLCSGKLETVGNRWRRLEPIVCPGSASREKRDALSDSFDFGARYRRGDDEFVLFPSEKEILSVRPESAVFRWRHIDGMVRLSITVAGDTTVLWSKNIRGDAKAFSSTELKTLFSSIRAKRPKVRLRLTLSSLTLKTENTADFELFSAQDETRLKRELLTASNPLPVVTHITRAGIYTDLRLFADAAMEFEEALKLSPESVDLLISTASAEDQAGNLTRRDEIDSRLKVLKRD